MMCVTSDPQGAQKSPKYQNSQPNFLRLGVFAHFHILRRNHISVNKLKPSSDIVLLEVLQHNGDFNTVLLRTKHCLVKIFAKE